MSNNHLIQQQDELSILLLKNIENESTFDQLLLNGANINYQTNIGWTVLFETIMQNRNDRLEKFIKQGIDLNIRDYASRNALFWAVYFENHGAFEILLDKNVDLEVHEQKKLHLLNYCVYKNEISFIDTLFTKKNLDINMQDHLKATPLFYALLYEHLDLVEYLLKKGANCHVIDSFGNSAYRLAKEKGLQEFFKS